RGARGRRRAVRPDQHARSRVRRSAGRASRTAHGPAARGGGQGSAGREPDPLFAHRDRVRGRAAGARPAHRPGAGRAAGPRLRSDRRVAPNGHRVSRALTSHEVARLAGVSQATVSRVLRDDQRVRPATRDRVLRVLAETKYEPNAAARAIRGRRTGSIGVVVARLSYQLYPAMLEAIGAQLARLDRRMIVWDAEHGGDQPAVRALRQGIVDGVILTAATAESQFLREVHSPEAPVVLVNRT